MAQQCASVGAEIIKLITVHSNLTGIDLFDATDEGARRDGQFAAWRYSRIPGISILDAPESGIEILSVSQAAYRIEIL